MGRTLICDLNVFYAIARGDLQASAVAQPDDTLAVSPVSVLELLGKLDEEHFTERRDCAHAIVSTGAHMLPDPEQHLAALFGSPVPPMEPFYVDAIKALAMATELEDLSTGVEDEDDEVVRRVDIATAALWRKAYESVWVSDVMAVMVKRVPGMGAYFNTPTGQKPGSPPKIRGKEKKALRSLFESSEWEKALVEASAIRACLRANMDPTDAQSLITSDAETSLELYNRMYTRYLDAVLTEGVIPRDNDTADLELFLYCTEPSEVLVTSEKKWHRFADDVKMSSRILKPQ